MRNHTQERRQLCQRLALSWSAVLVWAAIIFYFSAQSSLGTNWGIWDFILRKSAHFTEFAILSLLLWRAFRGHGLSATRALTPAAVLAIIYAFSDEFHQSFVTGRTPALRDVGIDMAGIIAAMLATAYLVNRRQRKGSA